MTEWLAAGLVLPVRLYHTTIRYLDPAGSEVQIENPFVHHRNETLEGPGDPWLYARAAAPLGGFLVGGRLGFTLPLGRTVEDPFVLGDMGIAHEHSQFGTGTFGVLAGVEVSRELGRFHVELAGITVQSLYDNAHGYRAGDRYAALLGIASHVGSKRFRLRTTVESVWETAETWSGLVHTDDGNVGRTDILAGLEATWLLDETWHVGASIKVPAYTHIEGGQLEALGFAGLSIGTHFEVFGGADSHRHEDGDEHSHDEHDGHGHHDGYDDHTDHDGPAPDWTGLDRQAVITDGRVVPLVPVPGKITVFDFWATWCNPCRVVDRELAEVARRHPDDVAVRTIDIVEADSPASTTYLGAQTIPHLKVYGRDGKLLWEKSAPPLELVGDVEAAIVASRPKATSNAPSQPPTDQPSSPPPSQTRKPAPPRTPPVAKRIAIEVTSAGYVPARVTIPRGVPVVLVVTRKTKATCATDIHFKLPDGTRVDRALPLDSPVEIPLTIDRAGSITYACGMDMIHGTLDVK